MCVCARTWDRCVSPPFAGQVVCRRHEASIFLCLYYYTQLLAVPAPVSISGAVSDTVWPKKRERESWIVLLMLLSAFDDAAAYCLCVAGGSTNESYRQRPALDVQMDRVSEAEMTYPYLGETACVACIRQKRAATLHV